MTKPVTLQSLNTELMDVVTVIHAPEQQGIYLSVENSRDMSPSNDILLSYDDADVVADILKQFIGEGRDV